tara:strand:+ start:5171 stop:8974 length:3804 start_codon:yes stop_codon:yes gene_type:complete
MAEIRNNFIKSKMNKDLDARLVPSGEYRDALNVAVSKSEGDDVGALENILGNFGLTDFGLSSITNLDIIGTYADLTNDRLFVFMTNYVDTSGDKLSNFASSNAHCYIGVYNTSTTTANLLVSGYFLNFSKTHPVLGINLIDDILFFTDNRNQPRKINVSSALANSSYYTLEDQISVAKYYPFSPIDLYRNQVTSLTGSSLGASYTAEDNVATTGGTGSGLTVNIVNANGVTNTTIHSPGYGYTQGDTITPVPRGPGSGATLTVNTEYVSTMYDVSSPTLPDNSTTNPYYDANWPGDPEYLQDKFVRFSYRFKFDDGEYSLMAPFTQECFVPQQDGYFLDKDEEHAYESTEVSFMQNKINNIILVLNVPGGSTNWDDVPTNLKVKEIEIIYKQSNENALRLLDSIPASDFIAHSQLFYEYQSRKPWKTLPTSALLRVYDQVPVRALAQEVAGNRVIYGNFVDKHTPPASLNYNLSTGFKETETRSPADPSIQPGYTIKEYQNHTLKQNRTYQVGIVLSDRYGRQSDVILSSIDTASIDPDLKGSTILHKYKTGLNDDHRTGVSAINSFSFTTATNATSGLYYTDNTWPGDSLKITFNDVINSIKNTGIGTPGLYSATNPTGWYTYKVVIKQTETDYYNVYNAGVLNGYISGDSANPLSASPSEPVAHIALIGDNINKIPRDLSLVGPNQTFFRTGRPNYNEDPSYYQFLDTNGVPFAADPYTEEGQALLQTRDRERDLDAGSQITNASVTLYPRVINYSTAGGAQQTAQYYPLSIVPPASRSRALSDEVVTIGTGTELGLWDPSAISPYNIAPVFYGYENNPYIAKIIIGSAISVSEIDGYGQVGPSTDAHALDYKITALGSGGGGTGYIAGSKNLGTEPISGSSSSGTLGEKGVGILVNVNVVGALTANGVNISNADSRDIKGFEMPVGTSSYTVDLKVNGGNNDGEVQLTVTKRLMGTTLAENLKPVLSVYETKPIESKLDIYWETSTAGLISELNTKIEANDTVTPASFVKTGTSSKPVYTQNEGMASGTDLSDDFKAVNFAGTVLPAVGTLTMTLDSVKDVLDRERKTEFQLVSGSTANSYKIKSNGLFYFGPNAGTEENYTFYIKVNSPSATYATDGTYVNSTLVLGSETGTPCLLSNTTPTNTPLSIGNTVLPASVPACGDTRTVSGVSSEDKLVVIFSATNGSADTSRNTDDLTFSLSQVIMGTPTVVNDYYLSAVSKQPGQIGLYVKGGSTLAQTTTCSVTATDAGQVMALCTLNVTTAT